MNFTDDELATIRAALTNDCTTIHHAKIAALDNNDYPIARALSGIERDYQRLADRIERHLTKDN